MAKKKCLTPGTWFCFRTAKHTQWASPGSNSAEFLLTLPADIPLTNARAKRLEKALHDAAENVMAPWFEERPDQPKKPPAHEPLVGGSGMWGTGIPWPRKRAARAATKTQGGA